MKKIYMAGKRSGKKSLDIISDIRKTLIDTKKMNEDIENVLKELK